MKKIVVTGPTSSLGLALINECVKNNIEVLALANKGSERISRISNSELVTVLQCSLDELLTLGNIMSDDSYDTFFHLAWASTSGDKARNMLEPQVMNIKYSLDAVDLADRLGCKTFIGAGSQAEYGRTNEILSEFISPHPESAYGMAKLCAGQMTRLACNQKEIKHIWTRILSAYGPYCQPQTVINYTLSELLARRKPSLSGCEQIWDFIYTEDVARALLSLAYKGHDGDIYVIGSGESRTLKEYLNTAKDIIDPNLELGFGEKPYTDTTVKHLACDIGKLKKDTGFEIKYSFEEGIKKTIEWMKDIHR